MADKLEIRKWLNRKGHHTTANIYLSMETETYDENDNFDREFWIHGHCDISDCFKKSTLQLGASTKVEARNTLYKLDTLIDTLEQAREFVASNMDGLKGR